MGMSHPVGLTAITVCHKYSGGPMKVPLAIPNLSGREAEYLQECIRSTFVSTAGPFVTRFEQQIAELSGTESAAVTCSGTVALQMALEGLGIGTGDLVMAPSLTFIASPNSIRHSRADVWLVDCTPDDWTLDLEVAEAAIEQETDPHPHGRLHRETGKVLKAIMPVMIMGASLDFEAYVEFARRHGLRVVVDAAAAIGASGADNTLLGATGVDAVCYSFNGNKTVTSGGGGAVASGDPELVARINHLVSTARVGTAYDHDEVGYNFRMTNVEAAIGVAQLERLPLFLERKRQIHERYAAVAGQHRDLEAFPTAASGQSVHWFSGFHYTGTDVTRCPRFCTFMVDRGIDVRPFWKPVHLQRPYSDAPRTDVGVTEQLWQRIIPLPCSTGITDDELDYVADAAAEFWADGATDA